MFILSAARAAALLSMLNEGCGCSRASAADIEAAPCRYRYDRDTITVSFKYANVYRQRSVFDACSKCLRLAVPERASVA